MSRFFTKTTNLYISAKNKDNDTKPSGYDPWGPPRSSMVSRMTLSSKSPVRNPQCPPSTPLLDPRLPDTLPIKIWARNFQGIFLGIKNIIHDVRNDPVLHVPVRNPQCPPSTPLLDPPLPDTLPIEISTRNFQGIFLGVKKHHSWHQEWPCPPCVWSGTLTVLQVPPFLTPHSWHISNNDISMKISG